MRWFNLAFVVGILTMSQLLYREWTNITHIAILHGVEVELVHVFLQLCMRDDGLQSLTAFLVIVQRGHAE